MTDFLSWWADHWPLIPALIAYFAWEAYKWRYRITIATAGTLVQGVVVNRPLPFQMGRKRRREP